MVLRFEVPVLVFRAFVKVSDSTLMVEEGFTA